MGPKEKYIVKRIEMIQRDLDELKKLIAGREEGEEVVSLRGLWAGANITDEEIEEARLLWFNLPKNNAK